MIDFQGCYRGQDFELIVYILMIGGVFLKKKNFFKEWGKVKKFFEVILSIMDNIICSRNLMRDDIGYFEKQKGIKKFNFIDVLLIFFRVV